MAKKRKRYRVQNRSINGISLDGVIVMDMGPSDWVGNTPTKKAPMSKILLTHRKVKFVDMKDATRLKIPKSLTVFTVSNASMNQQLIEVK